MIPAWVGWALAVVLLLQDAALLWYVYTRRGRVEVWREAIRQAHDEREALRAQLADAEGALGDARQAEEAAYLAGRALVEAVAIYESMADLAGLLRARDRAAELFGWEGEDSGPQGAPTALALDGPTAQLVEQREVLADNLRRLRKAVVRVALAHGWGVDGDDAAESAPFGALAYLELRLDGLLAAPLAERLPAGQWCESGCSPMKVKMGLCTTWKPDGMLREDGAPSSERIAERDRQVQQDERKEHGS